MTEKLWHNFKHGLDSSGLANHMLQYNCRSCCKRSLKILTESIYHSKPRCQNVPLPDGTAQYWLRSRSRLLPGLGQLGQEHLLFDRVRGLVSHIWCAFWHIGVQYCAISRIFSLHCHVSYLGQLPCSSSFFFFFSWLIPKDPCPPSPHSRCSHWELRVPLHAVALAPPWSAIEMKWRISCWEPPVATSETVLEAAAEPIMSY